MTYLELFNECVDKTGYITVGHLQYKIVNRILYFQCSFEKEDWVSNLDFPVVPYKHMQNKFYVHRGFIAMWKEARDIIATLDFDAIVGYSQGAIFASLTYEDTLFNKHIKCPCITFGSPRFLFMPSKTIQNRFSDVLRIKNPTDIVTKVPPAIFGYKHIGRELVLRDISVRPPIEKYFVRLSGHSPSRYRQNLGAVS